MSTAIDYGANVNGQSYYGRTPLMTASIHGKTEAVDFLLKHHADPSIIDEKGLTAYLLAINGKNFAVAQMLRAAGAKHKLLMTKVECF